MQTETNHGGLKVNLTENVDQHLKMQMVDENGGLEVDVTENMDRLLYVQMVQKYGIEMVKSVTHFLIINYLILFRTDFNLSIYSFSS